MAVYVPIRYGKRKLGRKKKRMKNIGVNKIVRTAGRFIFPKVRT